jgi:hypothetical protein
MVVVKLKMVVVKLKMVIVKQITQTESFSSKCRLDLSLTIVKTGMPSACVAVAFDL